MLVVSALLARMRISFQFSNGLLIAAVAPGRFGVPFTTMGRPIIQPNANLHPRYAEAKRRVRSSLSSLLSSQKDGKKYNQQLNTVFSFKTVHILTHILAMVMEVYSKQVKPY